jgi:hypothetical protein
MAKNKGKSKRKSKSGAGVGAGGVALAALGNALGNILGQLLADGVGAASGKTTATGADDVAAQLLTILAERGPLSIPELVEATGAGLTPVLESLQTIRDFRLVEFIGEGELVTLTTTGNKTVTVVQKENIRRQAARMLAR